MKLCKNCKHCSYSADVRIRICSRSIKDDDISPVDGEISYTGEHFCSYQRAGACGIDAKFYEEKTNFFKTLFAKLKTTTTLSDINKPLNKEI